MNPSTSEPDAAEAWIEEWSAEADERTVRARAFADSVASLTATAQDGDGPGRRRPRTATARYG